MSGFRLPTGGLVDRERPFDFTFDGRACRGFAGDTLASALLASGVSILGRSFKLHRPRGLLAAGPEEPNALVEIGEGARREPNRPATMVELRDGLVARSQNRWPSLAVDIMAVNGLLAPLLPAGFYYKTFTWPAPFWERVYEPLIRRAAGLGRAPAAADPDRYEHVHAHADVLVVGAGAAGLAAALAAAQAGAQVILADQDALPGGGTLLEPELAPWREAVLADLGTRERVTLLPRTSVVGAYDHGVFAAVERVSDHRGTPEPGQPRQRLWVIRTARTVLATGATERLVAFPGNDRPGVMLAGAVFEYARRYGVAAGRRAVLFAADDGAYAAVLALAQAGLRVEAIVDPRPAGPAAAGAEAAGLRVLAGHEVFATAGGKSLRSVEIRPTLDSATSGGKIQRIEADLLAVSGGWSPNAALVHQAQLPLRWSPGISAFVPASGDGPLVAAGAANGTRGLAAAAREGGRAGLDAARAAGWSGAADVPPLPWRDAQESPARPLWEVRAPGKAFVDLQHDVTADDVRLAVREGYQDVEHLKRYTTHGMGTDQGRTGGLVGSAVLAAARNLSVGSVGQSRPRPFVQPVAWGTLAGPHVGEDFKPKRRLPLHDWHAAHGAVFVNVGLWQRPLVYSPAADTSWGPVLEEARAVRESVGLNDASTLGKIDVQGPGAAAFLDRIYATPVASLAVGRARYGLMLREDGFLFDDGTIARLGPEQFLLSTTTQKYEDVLLHLEWHAETVWPDLDVTITGVVDHWAQFALAGKRARDVLTRVAEGVDLGNEAFPFMAVGEASFAGVPGKLFRISFSGELAYEIAVPSPFARHVWEALLAAGAPEGIRPYGLDALNVLRIEKGHVTGGEVNGNTTPADLGLGRMLKKQGDFIGKVLGLRPGLHDPDRLQLVGVTPVEPGRRLRGGAHLVALAGSGGSQGVLTAACMAAEGEGWIGLALLAGGHRRHGERLVAAAPVDGEETEVVIGSPHRIDPENARVRA
jgi:methylglutamate dehydrogenase subunit C